MKIQKETWVVEKKEALFHEVSERRGGLVEAEV